MNDDAVSTGLGVSAWWIGLVGMIVTAGFAWPAAAADDESAEKLTYRLEERWVVVTEANGYRREKTIRVQCELEAYPNESGAEPSGLEWNVRAFRVECDADVPAQGRKATFDSESPDSGNPEDAYEFARYTAWLDRDLTLAFTEDGKLDRVRGTERLMRGLDDWYDEHLRGSEVDLLTRSIESQQLDAQRLRHWLRDAIRVNPGMANEGDEETATTLDFMACVPSESWLRPMELPVIESTQGTSVGDQGGRLERVWRLDPNRATEVVTEIGPVRWDYTPRSVSGRSSASFDASGWVSRLDASRRAQLDSTLYLNGREIAMTMEIERQLSVEQLGAGNR